MWIPLELISPKFRELKKDMLNCKTDDERKKLLEDSKRNWRYAWVAKEIKEFFNSKRIEK